MLYNKDKNKPVDAEFKTLESTLRFDFNPDNPDIVIWLSDELCLKTLDIVSYKALASKLEGPSAHEIFKILGEELWYIERNSPMGRAVTKILAAPATLSAHETFDILGQELWDIDWNGRMGKAITKIIADPATPKWFREEAHRAHRAFLDYEPYDLPCCLTYRDDPYGILDDA